MFHSSLSSQIFTPSMEVAVFGVNYQTAPAGVRERLAFSPEEVAGLLREMRSCFPTLEVALLATCNRTEWLLCAEELPDVATFICEKGFLSVAELEAHSFFLQGRDAVRHVYRVACGLDSMILGEPQILGQLKAAYRLAKSERTLGSSLERLLQQSFSVAKQVRSHTAIGENPVSVAYAGVRLLHQFFDDCDKRCALVIGAGETAQLVVRYLRDLGVERLVIANRSLKNAQVLAEKVGGYAIALPQIAEHLHEADMVFGAAQSDVPLLSRSQVLQSLKKRRNAFQVLVDLSMPRIFSTDIDELDHVFLYGLDDLAQIIDHNRESRQRAAKQAEVMIHLHSDDFIGWLNSKPQQALIRQIRAQAEAQRQALLSEAYRRLALGEDPALILEQMSYKLSNKLLHPSSAMIHAIPPNHRDWLAIVAEAFDKERNHL